MSSPGGGSKSRICACSCPGERGGQQTGRERTAGGGRHKHICLGRAVPQTPQTPPRSKKRRPEKSGDRAVLLQFTLRRGAASLRTSVRSPAVRDSGYLGPASLARRCSGKGGPRETALAKTPPRQPGPSPPHEGTARGRGNGLVAQSRTH